MRLRSVLSALFLMCPLLAGAQHYMFEDIQYSASASGTAGGGDEAPFWFTANRYGLSTRENYSGLFRVELHRNAETDSLHFWRVGYGLDLASPIYKNSGYFCIQQAFFDLEWSMLRLSVGQKERPLEFRGPVATSSDVTDPLASSFPVLSMGGLTSGINARPVPQVRLEMPRFWAIPGTKGFFSFKAHIAFGWYTDGRWQRENNDETANVYTSGSRYHSKALFLKFGNEKRFPLVLSGGIEMSAQFGGHAYNLRRREDWSLFDMDLNDGIKGYLHAFIPSGSDATDGADYANVEGNHLGSWHARLEWKDKKWSVAGYLEHQFEDHSQMFWQYAWNDMLLGFEANLPRNRFLSSLVYEYLGTTDQSGAVYHDHTAALPDQVSARDDYYNHMIYGSWQHSGHVMGVPLILSPLYNNDGTLGTYHNRVKAHHIGLAGEPCLQLSWRFLYTHEKSLGTYKQPTADPLYGDFFLLEATWRPRFARGLSITGSYGHNGGDFLGQSDGGMLTVRYSGWINSTH